MMVVAHKEPGGTKSAGYFDDYKSYADIVTRVNYYATTFFNTTRLLTTAGKTIEQRNIPILHVTATGNSKRLQLVSKSTKPIIWYDPS